MRKINKVATVVVTGAVAVGAAGVAYSYWSTSGSGSGTAATATGAASLDVQQLTSPQNLAPGVTSGAVTGSVKNTATNNAYTTQIVVSIASVDVTAASGTCATSDFGLVSGTTSGVLDSSTPGATSITLPFVHDMTPSQTLSMPAFQLGFVNKATSQDGCKGAVPHLSYDVS